MVASACTTGDLSAEGRPCGNGCGPGTTCNAATNTCVAGPVTDAAPPDAPAGDIALNDGPATDADAGGSDSDIALLPDQLQPDLFVAPDGGCPTGLTRCGKVCVDLQKSTTHCGSCNNKCPNGTSDSCVSGKCSCGSSSTTPAVCSNRLNCVSGKCTCLKGGLCKGCCQNNTCYKTSVQSVSRCGNAGAACAVCSDSNVCTSDSCSSTGVCTYKPYTTIKTCDDKNLCTYSDKCNSSGKCVGTSYKCSDGLSCTTDTCTGTGGCSYKINSGNCAITSGSTKKCYITGAAKPGTSCYLCDSTKSQTSWTYPSNCINSNRVGSVVPFGSLGYPRDVWVTSSGDVLVADTNYHVIRKISSTGVTVVAGYMGAKGFVNGTGTSARFNYPYSITQDSSGNIYVADRSNHAIRKISSSGVVSTLAGTGSAGTTDGTATSARFYYPSGVAYDTSTGALFVTDTSNHTIRRIYGSTVSTVAGSAGSLGSTNGYGSTARFYRPHGIAYRSNYLYVADTYNNKIRQVQPYNSYYVTTIAGTGTTSSVDGSATTVATFNRPWDVSLYSTSRIYVTDSSGHRLRLISGGSVSTLAGAAGYGYQDGPATTAKFRYPYGLHVASVSNKAYIYIADYSNRNIRLVKLTSYP